MNKKIATLSLIALSSIFLAGCTKRDSVPNQTQAPAQTMSEASEFAKAIESGKPTICTMTKGEDKMEYLIKGKKMRMNTSTSMAQEDGKTELTVGHMINDTSYLYFWDDKTGQGSKMAVPTEEEAKKLADDAKKYENKLQNTPSFENESDYKALTDEGYTISCKAGAVDDSVFTPPSSVKFIDPTEMMKALPAPGTGGSIDMSKLKELQKQYGGDE